MTKKTIVTLSDHPLSPSGVGTQTKYVMEALLKTGRYRIISLGGAIKHDEYQPQKIEPYGEDWVVYPVDGYGNHDIIRSLLRKEKPDLLWFMTDPRFYGWLWEIENEIRAVCPMMYYHVWDNYPAPSYNGAFYRATDEVVAISKLTYDIVRDVNPDGSTTYLPHAVPNDIFFKYKNPEHQAQAAAVRERLVNNCAPELKNPDKKVFIWNNRNARRKQSGSILWWFKEWLDIVGHDKATLLMHTDPRDPHGQDLPHLIAHLGADKGQIFLSTEKVDAEHLADLYNAADFTINISDAEGFGLATLESLSCGTPIIVNMTGGLQEQVTDGTNWFGYGIEPASKALIGSLQVPYIYEDRISQQDFNDALTKALNLRPKAYKKMCIQGREHVQKNYNFDTFKEKWVKLMDETIEKHGSWETRQNYQPWQLWEVA